MQTDMKGVRWAYLLVGVADGTLLPFVPLYLLERGLNAAAIGAVLAGMAVVWLFTGLAWGYLADHRYPPERILLTGASMASVVGLTLALAPSGVVLAALILVLTFVRSPLTLLDPIALRMLRTKSRTGYARIRLLMSAGWTVSATASGLAYHAFGLVLIPFLYAPLTAVVALCAWRGLKPEARDPAVVGVRSFGGGVRLNGIPVAMLGFLASCLLLGVALAATQNFVTLQIDVLGGGALLVGAAAAFQSLTEIPTMGFTHVFTKRLSSAALYALGCGIYLAVFVAWALVSNAMVVALLKLAVGVGFALTYVASVTIANELTPPRLRATGQALFKSAMFGVAPVIGAFGGGVVYQTAGARLMFLASTLVVGAAGTIALVVVPRPGRRAEAPVVTPEPAPATP